MNTDPSTTSHGSKKREACLPACMLIFVLSIFAAGQAAHAQTPGKTKAKKPPAQGTRSIGTQTPLALNEYLTQVTEKHTGHKAADQISKAAKLQAAEGSLLFKPVANGQGVASSEGQANPFDSGAALSSRSYSLGVTQPTNFGLSGTFSYNRNELEANAGPLSGTYTASWLQLELRQSLLRNWAGAELRRQSEAIEAGALAKSYTQSFVAKQILLEAETNYWRLALARELVAVQKDAVERAERLHDWTSRRVRLQLADRADALNASTNLQARKLDLRSAEDEERASAQAFNSSRGLNSNEVSEKLDELTPDVIVTMKIPARTETRDDVKAAEQQTKAAAANALVSREKNKPTIELFGVLPMTQETNASSVQLAASANSNVTSRPGTTVGLRLAVPLDFGTQDHVRQGYAAEAAATDQTYRRRVFEEERDWSDLTAKFEQTKERLKLYADLENVQKTKLDYERDRQQRGRSTLQQVLLFEADYEQAQLGRIRTSAELLTLNAQMKLYGVSYESR